MAERATAVHTEADLFTLWQRLMGPGSFGKRTLWLLFLRPDDYPCGVIVPIEDVPGEPDLDVITALERILDDVVAAQDVGSVPVLLSRPGPSAMTDRDRRWAATLRDGLGRHLGRWPVHLATYERLQVFAPDDLIAARRRPR